MTAPEPFSTDAVLERSATVEGPDLAPRHGGPIGLRQKTT